MSVKLRASPCRTGWWGTALTERLRSADARPAVLRLSAAPPPLPERGAPPARAIHSHFTSFGVRISGRLARTGHACLAAFLSAALLLLALSAAAPASASPEDNSLIVALERFPDGFNPAVASGSLTSQIGAQLFAGLVRIGKDGPIPYLAESWDIDPQARRFRFHLRKGATFHDGTPITANDVAFSIRAAQRHHPCFRTGFAPGPLQRALRFTD